MEINASFEYDDSIFEEYDEIQMHSLIWNVGLITMIAYIVIFCFGVPANIYVMCRLRKFAKEDREKYENGTGLTLFVMTTCDLFSLVAISLQHIQTSFSIDMSGIANSLACKTLIFATHTMTSISIWSWLLMSTLRYLAVRHPLFHLRVWRAPYRAIALIVFLSALTNVWLLFVVSSGATGCEEQTIIVGSIGGVSANHWLHLVECIWSYCLPVVMILYMDTMAFLCCPCQSRREMSIGKRNGSALVQGTTTQPSNQKANRGLWKWMIIAFIDVMLNTPENICRLIILLNMPVTVPKLYFYTFRMVAQALYFAQFAFNAVYLSLFVFDKNIRPDPPQSSTQSFAVIAMRLTNTQGYSSIEQLRRNRYSSLINFSKS